ncbi:EmrB/QacA subfamily drug resistance transporter [Streptomyces sp. Amel2xB2]|uniref:MFS transporter n=1 Tax=Streptomyces sp. Amel2xB2 TaxID=1305829 RepID=UPI000DB9FF20|nr:MFS transporter [Streptomyces sp. Amel2xB2]RAJ67157.1 EmrB/QacA subfamily drug resistance transporter [Streptomyces sp. Amel2xB2]
MAAAGESGEGHPRRWAILVAICAALLVIVVDNTVLNVALPSIATEFGASTGHQQAVLDAYVVVFAGLLIPAGAVSDRYGRRGAMLAGLLLLGAASAAAALAWSVWWLIAMRAVMGLGAALVMPATLALLVQVFPVHERPRAFAVWGAVASGAVALGPVLGGSVVGAWSWAGAFLINVPVIVVAVAAILRLVPESRVSDAGPFDVAGAALIALAMVALTGAVIVAGERGPFDPYVVLGGLLTVAALYGFERRRRRARAPIVELSLYRDRQFAGGSAAAAVISLGTGSTLFILAQHLQLVLGYSAFEAGLAAVPLALGIVLGSLAGGRAPARIGHRLAIVCGFAVTTAGFLVLAALTPGSSYGVVAVGLVFVGAGNGFAGPAVTSTVLGAVPPERTGMGSALNDTHQQFGVAFGVALMGSLLAAVYRAGLPDAVPAGARGSLSTTLVHAARTDSGQLAAAARESFAAAQTVTMLVAAGCAAAGAVIAAATLRPDAPRADRGPAPEGRTPSGAGDLEAVPVDEDRGAAVDGRPQRGG